MTAFKNSSSRRILTVVAILGLGLSIWTLSATSAQGDDSNIQPMSPCDKFLDELAKAGGTADAAGAADMRGMPGNLDVISGLRGTTIYCWDHFSGVDGDSGAIEALALVDGSAARAQLVVGSHADPLVDYAVLLRESGIEVVSDERAGAGVGELWTAVGDVVAASRS